MPRPGHQIVRDARGPSAPPAGPPDAPEALAACVARIDRTIRRLLPVLVLSERPLRPDLWRIALED